MASTICSNHMENHLLYYWLSLCLNDPVISTKNNTINLSFTTRLLLLLLAQCCSVDWAVKVISTNPSHDVFMVYYWQLSCILYPEKTRCQVFLNTYASVCVGTFSSIFWMLPKSFYKIRLMKLCPMFWPSSWFCLTLFCMISAKHLIEACKPVDRLQDTLSSLPEHLSPGPTSLWNSLARDLADLVSIMFVDEKSIFFTLCTVYCLCITSRCVYYSCRLVVRLAMKPWPLYRWVNCTPFEHRQYFAQWVNSQSHILKELDQSMKVYSSAVLFY